MQIKKSPYTRYINIKQYKQEIENLKKQLENQKNKLMDEIQIIHPSHFLIIFTKN